MFLKKFIDLSTSLFSGALILFGVILVQQLTLFPLLATVNVENLWGKIVLTVITIGIQILLAYALIRILNRKIYLCKILTERRSAITLMFLITAVLLIQLATSYLQSINFLTSTDNQNLILQLYNKNQIGTLISTTILGPILEELTFRVLIIDRWEELFGKSSFSYGVVILVSSLLFAFMHEPSLSVNLLPYFAVGVVLSASYIKTKRLEVPIMGHMLLNVISFI